MNWIGTSGFNYPEWLGQFYPTELKRAQMLAYYAERFNSVEINYTFFRSPSEKTLRTWSGETPSDFKFGFKAPRFVTHTRKLREAGEATARFMDALQPMGSKLGVVLFQLPPDLNVEEALLQSFLAQISRDVRVAIEFRHPSWFSKKVFRLLRKHNVALCIADSAALSTPVEQTADFIYFRLRNEQYTERDIEHWANIARVCGAAARDMYVYFKHEATASGPRFAQQFRRFLQG